MLSTALALASKKLSVFPCAVRGKEPRTAHGCLDATTDADQIRRWWVEEPQSNIAIATGAVSRVFVLDIDGLDAERELAALERQFGPLPRTVESITAKGRHVFFRTPDTLVRDSASKIGCGLDTRGEHGYVLVPPSVHPSGKKYCWSVDSASSFADAPAWLLDKIAEPPAKAATPSADWQAIVNSPVMEGVRDTTLAKLAGYLLRRYVDPYVVLELVQGFNARRCTPPLSEADTYRIVNSIAGIERRRRGSNV